MTWSDIVLKEQLGYGAENGSQEHEGRKTKLKAYDRDFLMVQWIRLCVHNAGGSGSTPDWGTRSPMPQLRPDATK